MLTSLIEKFLAYQISFLPNERRLLNLGNIRLLSKELNIRHVIFQIIKTENRLLIRKFML